MSQPTPTTNRDYAITPRVAVLVRCPACGGSRRASTYPHAPRWVGGVQRDCRGEVVR